MKNLGLAIVGCGQIATHHLTSLLTIGDGADADADHDAQQEKEDSCRFVLRALCDPSPERRKVLRDIYIQHHRGREGEGGNNNDEDIIAEYETLDDLIHDEKNQLFETNRIDVIFIAVPHDLHKSIALQALATGKRVVLEKPLAPTREECDCLVEASIENPGRLIIAEQSPYWQEVVLAKQLIERGEIGSSLITAASYYYESMRTNITSGSVDENSGGLGWRGSLDRAGGGIALDGSLHWIRPLREMCGGRIERVTGVTRSNIQPSLQMEGETLAHAIFEIAPHPSLEPAGPGPLLGTFSCNMLATAPMAHDACPYFRITGTKGELIIHGDGLFKEKPGAGGLRLYNDVHPEGKEMFPADRDGGFFLGFAGLWREIARICIQDDASAAHESVIRASDDVRVALALYKSSQSGMWETT